MGTDAPGVIKIAAGTRARDYRKHFIRHDIAAIGPGWIGKWGHVDPEEFGPGDRRALGALVAAAPGDLALLAVGTEIVTIGEVCHGYDWKEDMALVGGWDLYHFIRVKWADPMQVRACRGPRHVSTTSRAHWLGPRNANVSRCVRRIHGRLSDAGHFRRRLRRAPGDDARLSKHEQLDSLGTVIERAQTLKRAVDDRDWESSPSEHEAVALLVVPLLLELAWRPESLALEWNRIDVAAFSGTDRSTERCKLLVEAKRPGQGLVFARGQAFEYAHRHGLEVPILTTDGFFYALYGSHAAEDPIAEIYLPDIRTSAKRFLDSLDMIAPDPPKTRS